MLLVKNWDTSGVPSGVNPTRLNGMAGQGNDNPQSEFNDHQVNIYGNRIFDPSYGESYESSIGVEDSLRLWENGSIDAIRFQLPTSDYAYILNRNDELETRWAF